MSLVDHIVKTKTLMELAKELIQCHSQNIKLKSKVGQLETELFWTNVHFQKLVQRAQYVLKTIDEPEVSVDKCLNAVNELRQFLKDKHE